MADERADTRDTASSGECTRISRSRTTTPAARPSSNTLGLLAERLALALDCWECCIYEYVPERDAVLPKALWSQDMTDDDRAWVGVENHLNRQPHVAPVFGEHRIVVTQADPEALDPADRESMAYWGEKTALYAPVLDGDELLGVVELVERRERREFNEGDLRLVMGLADVAAIAIVNARLYDRLEVQAITDGLTGLYNHRFFYDRLNAEVTRSRRYGLQLSLLMLDLDDFKRFNDEFGHQAGDRVLAEVGRIMREQLRKDVDIPCRYGGEEFAVILPHTPAPGAETVGRRLTELVTRDRRRRRQGRPGVAHGRARAPHDRGRALPRPRARPDDAHHGERRHRHVPRPGGRRQTRSSATPTRRCTWPSTAARTGSSSSADGPAPGADARRPSRPCRMRGDGQGGEMGTERHRAATQRMNTDIDFLRALCGAPAPTGFEAPAQEVLRRRLEGIGRGAVGPPRQPVGRRARRRAPRTSSSRATTTRSGSSSRTSTSTASSSSTRWAAWTRSCSRDATCSIHSAKGPVDAVVGRKPTHIIPKDEQGKAPALHEQFMDIGASSRATRRWPSSRVGDPVTFEAPFLQLAGGRYGSPAFDNRAGVYVAFRALEHYGAAPAGAKLTALATVHEETTFMGARAMARRLDADVIVVVDVDFASEDPSVDPKKLGGEVKLGAGPVIHRGAGSNLALVDYALEVAKDEASPSRSRRCPGGRRPTPRSSCRRAARRRSRSASLCATCTRRSR